MTTGDHRLVELDEIGIGNQTLAELLVKVALLVENRSILVSNAVVIGMVYSLRDPLKGERKV